jgi:hypothetical protein
MGLRALAAALLLGTLAAARPVIAAEPPALSVPLAQLASPAADVEARSRFLEDRLADGRTAAQAWQWGWTGLYTFSTLGNGVAAATTDDGDDRVYAVVETVKSGVAAALMLLDPLPARLGAEPMRAVPAGDRLQRLAVGERQLVVNAERAATRYGPARHLATVASGLLGGAVIWALGDGSDAVRSTLVGIAVGEAQIWSQPWRATGDLRDYRAGFPAAAGTGVGWELRPMATGVQLALRF